MNPPHPLPQSDVQMKLNRPVERPFAASRFSIPNPDLTFRVSRQDKLQSSLFAYSLITLSFKVSPSASSIRSISGSHPGAIAIDTSPSAESSVDTTASPG